MRTITEHNDILNSQAKSIYTTITSKAQAFGRPYMWNTDYWHGYCDGIDNSGSLWEKVYEMTVPMLNKLNVLNVL